MQPDPEADALPALLHEEYGAPQLDEQFSADLIARLQAEAASRPTVSVKPRRSMLAICLGVATVAGSIIAIIWMLNQGNPGDHEVNPKTGKRHSLGKPDWANTKAIMTIGDMLYIAANGQLHRVNPSDGSHEVLPSKGDRPNHPRQPKP